MNYYIKDWSESDHKQASKAIRKFLKSRKFITNEKCNAFAYCTTFRQIEGVLGLAYTSSGECAGLWVSNCTLYLDDAQTWKIYGFIRDLSGWFYAVCLPIEGGSECLYIMIG